MIDRFTRAICVNSEILANCLSNLMMFIYLEIFISKQKLWDNKHKISLLGAEMGVYCPEKVSIIKGKKS